MRAWRGDVNVTPVDQHGYQLGPKADQRVNSFLRARAHRPAPPRQSQPSLNGRT
jgi:hypothetical protein